MEQGDILTGRQDVCFIHIIPVALNRGSAGLIVCRKLAVRLNIKVREGEGGVW